VAAPARRRTAASHAGRPAASANSANPPNTQKPETAIRRAALGTVSEPRESRTWKRATATVLTSIVPATSQVGAVVWPAIQSGTASSMTKKCMA
jgi:hypothetical protein